MHVSGQLNETSQRNDLRELKNHVKNFKLSAAFLVFFLVTESMMSWDWIMSIDPHWFSTLFGWYVFASMVVSAVTTIALISIYLKSNGYLPNVNSNTHYRVNVILILVIIIVY